MRVNLESMVRDGRLSGGRADLESLNRYIRMQMLLPPEQSVAIILPSPLPLFEGLHSKVMFL